MPGWIQVALGLALVACGTTPRRIDPAVVSTEPPSHEQPSSEQPAAEAQATQTAPSVTVSPRGDRSADGWQASDIHHAAQTGRVGAPFVTGVWGAAPDDVFAVGNDGLLVHFDGRTWSARPAAATEHYSAVWGHSGQLFVAGMDTPAGGLIRHFDGQRWRRQTTPPAAYLSALWGSSAQDVFAVGAQGTIFHYDGAGWSRQPSGVTQDLLGVWGSAANDVFAVGHTGTIVHYDGRQWSTMTSSESAHLRGVWGSGAGDVFVAGDERLLHYDGRAWTALTMERDFLYAISGNGPDDVIAVGHNGVRLRFDGQTWQRNPVTLGGSIRSAGGGNIHILDPTFSSDLASVWAGGPGRLFAVGRGIILSLTETR